MLTIFLALALGGSPTHAIIPNPSSERIYCSVNGRKVECWCDEWMRYPLCRRWHWH